MRMTDSIRAWWPAGIAILVALALSGCSTTAEDSGLSLVDASGHHPPGFVSTHPSLVLSVADTAKCQPCHGDGLAGGIADVSCFSASRGATACHHPSPAAWSTRAQHGAAAKRAPGGSSFIVCAICHGAGFAGGGSGTSCLNNGFCHGAGVDSPHPRRPWRGLGTDNTHSNTNQANVPVCDGCHHRGQNSTRLPSPPAPEGTIAGCYNNTLCHAAAARHATDGSFLPPAAHGATAKQDLAACQECHGTPGTILFDGGLSIVKCSDCHLAAKAHPTDWQGSGTYTHRNSTNRGTACTICHDGEVPGRAAPDPGAPSCFSANFTNQEGQSRSCHSGGPGD